MGKSKEQLTETIYNVFVDFVFDEGLLFIVIKNNGINPVFNVYVSFDCRIFGLNGEKDVNSMNLFRNIEFLAPNKEIKTFLDSCESYFKREQPSKIGIEVTYKDINKKSHTVIIKHNLEIYRDIVFLSRRH